MLPRIDAAQKSVNVAGRAALLTDQRQQCRMAQTN